MVVARSGVEETTVTLEVETGMKTALKKKAHPLRIGVTTTQPVANNCLLFITAEMAHYQVNSPDRSSVRPRERDLHFLDKR